jgi:hypothetical protein
MIDIKVRFIDPSLTRAALRGGEAVFGAGLVCPAVLRALDGLGLSLRDLTEVNFVTRSAPMGPVPAEVVQATFFNFNPDAITPIIPGAWQKATPNAILAAQAAAFSGPLAGALSSIDRDVLAELADLSRRAAEAAAPHREGRPLFAAMVSLPWPTEDHMIIWHAGKLLREHRGDGHLACLMVQGLSGIDALIVHEAFDPRVRGGILRSMRQWSTQAWAAALTDLRERGWLTDDEPPTLTDEGLRRRQWIEDRTDELAAVAYDSIGSVGIERMITIGAEVVAALKVGGLGIGDHVRRFLITERGGSDAPILERDR